MYLNGAAPTSKEVEFLEVAQPLNASVIACDDGIYLEMDVPIFATDVVDTEKLGTLRLVDAVFDTPQGTQLVIDIDYFGNERKARTIAGPFSQLNEGKNKIKVW